MNGCDRSWERRQRTGSSLARLATVGYRALTRNGYGETALVSAVAALVALLTMHCVAPDRRSMAEALGPRPPGAGRREAAARGTPVPFRAFVVFQLSDCDGRLRALELLEHPELRRAVALDGLLLAGSPRELETARARLSRRDWARKVRRLDRRGVDALAPLGHRVTPFLVILDAQGAVRLAAPLPVTPAEYLSLRRAVRGLAWRPT